MNLNISELATASLFPPFHQLLLLSRPVIPELIPQYHYHEFTGTSATHLKCSQFWDPVNARICTQYLPLVAAIPLGVVLCLIVSHILRLLIPYRPKWLQSFIKEVTHNEPHKSLLKRHGRLPTFVLFILAICGVILQAVIIWESLFQLEKLFPALTWTIAAFLIAILRPRTSPASMLWLYISLAMSQIIILRETSTSQNELFLVISQLLLEAISIIVILWMPLRDPSLSNDEISAVYTSPTFDLRSPEDNLTLWQFLTVAWMKPLIALGSKRQLNDEDVWLLGYEFQHSYLHQNFRELRGSVVRKLLKANGIDLVLLSVLGIIDLLATLSIPVLLQQLLRAMENPLAPKSTSVLYAGLSLVVRLISAEIGVFSLWYGRRCYERSRGEMITMLYEKTLSRKIAGATPNVNSNETRAKSSQDQNQESRSRLWRLGQILAVAFRWKKPKEEVKERASMGKILNLMRNDVYEVAQRFWEFQSLITTPISLVLSVVLIWKLIGWPCLFGALTVIIAQGLNVLFARALLRYERKRRTATDKKLTQISPFVEAIRHLRYYGWQSKWCEKIMEAREHELSLRLITGSWSVLISFTNAFGSGMFPVAAFYAYSYLAGLPLRIEIAFPALQVFSILESNLRALPGLITVLLNARVAVGRIEDFMNEPDKDHHASNGLENKTSSLNGNPTNKGKTTIVPAAHDDAEAAPRSAQLELKNASFSWPGNTSPVLTDVSISFPIGMTVICGEVGSGKSALLQAILGELDQNAGEIIISDEMIGYCAQTPWLQSMSIRENILFSAPYEEERYKKVLEACALISDISNFKHGDLSNIGENGIGLSGGQRARVALARAIYSRAEILLLDDPISALDHRTAEFVIRNCLTGKLVEGRTVVLVTHRVDACKDLAQQLIEIKNGNARILDFDASDLLHEIDSSDSAPEPEEEVNNEDKDAAAIPDKFIQEEYRAHGSVQARVYWEYIRAGKLKWWFLLTCFLILGRVVNVGRTWFLQQWGEAYDRPKSIISRGLLDQLPSPETDLRPWLYGFGLLAAIQAISALFTQIVLLVIMLTAARKMFKEIMVHVGNAVFRFYDVTPVGRLMNRLTSDISIIDGGISSQFMNATRFLVLWITSLVVIASVTPIFLAFSIALTMAFVLVFMRFLPTSQSLRRLEMASLSPLMSNFGALLDGLTTVRAFKAQKRFQDRVIAVTDAFQKMDHFYWSLQAWLMFRFDLLSDFSTLILTLIAIYTGISSGLTAFVLIAAQNFVNSTHGLCRSYGQLQMDFVSVERVVELIHVEQENPGSIDPPAWWPTLNGDIVFENATMRYAPHLDPSLSELSFTIKGGSSTAIVGRTGSGKSTLAMALLATILPDSGRILIDNIDIAKVNKQALRERITFVAQDPVLFPGTMRLNLDPMEEFEDEECERVLLKICGRHEWKLDTVIEAGGRNLSQGQRQLIGLARTLLRQSPIVILDEATASIDMETANIIQEILHDEMKGRTVITIAHRLEAVRNAEYGIVLGKGRLLRYGSAQDILNEDGSDLGASADSVAGE